jgi:hypothetical protein
MTEANKRQVGGDHYQEMGVLEHWDLAAMYGWDYFAARTIAYIMRWRTKGGIQDLEKARHFLDKYIEVETLRMKGMLTLGIMKAAIARLDEEVRYNVNGDDPYGADTVFEAGLPRTARKGAA